MVMVCAFLCTFTLDGICYVFGVFLDPLKQDFGVGDGAMSAVGSVLSGKLQIKHITLAYFIFSLKNFQKFLCRYFLVKLEVLCLLFMKVFPDSKFCK